MKAQPRPVLDLPENLDTPEGCREALASLARQEGELDTELGALRTERDGLALDIARGQPAATKRNEFLAPREVELLKMLDLVTAVRGRVQERLATAEAAEAAAVAEARRVEAQGFALELLEHSRRADEAMREAAEAMAARAAAARKVSGYGGNLNALMNRARSAAAAGYAGLDQVLEVRRSPRGMHASLESMDRKILAGLVGKVLPDQAAEPPRHGVVQMGPIPPPPPVPPAPKPDPSVRW